MRPNARNLISLAQDEGGQAATEYILMLSIVVGLFMILVKQFIRPLFARLQTIARQSISNALFRSGQGFHQLRIGR